MARKASLEPYREFLKDTIRLEIDFSQTDQHLGFEPPPIEKPAPPSAPRVPLPPRDAWRGLRRVDLAECIARRESRRNFAEAPLALDELSFLLWATQGVRQVIDRGTALRTVPSAGARHALETYLCAMRVEGLEPAIYRYLPLKHELVRHRNESSLADRLGEATLGQDFVGRAAVVFVWTAIPYRMEWRYERASHKVIAIDAGHVCQNLYLACEAIDAGACAVAAYHQHKMDELIGVDGDDEFVIYLAPVGKKA